MQVNLDEFFCMVSHFMLNFTEDLDNNAFILYTIKELYKNYIDKKYNGGIQRYLFREYQKWLMNCKVNHMNGKRLRSLKM